MSAFGFVTLGCAEPEELSFCDAYGDYVVIADEIRTADATEANAKQVRDAIEEARGAVAILQQRADGRYGDQLEALEVALNDTLRVIDSVDDDADFSTWQPLIEDSVDDVRDAADRVESDIGPSCDGSS